MEVYDKLYIDGNWVKSNSSVMSDIINPANEKVWAQVVEGNEEDVDLAVKAARNALKGPWKTMDVRERSAILRKMGDLIRENATKLANIQTRENGKLSSVALVESKRVSEWWYYYAGLADKIQGATIPVEDSKHIFTIREPIGVVGCITPWNGPLVTNTMKLSVALAAGNTIVLKPSETTPITALEMAKLADQAGFPPGVINVVTGSGSVVGSHLSAHQDVDKISFTGSGLTARNIMKSATSNIKKLSFELGGKSPHIIFPDANLNQALKYAVKNAFSNTGQACILGSRVLVHEDIYDEFIQKFKEKTKQIKVGNPEEDVDMGPHSHKQQLDKTMEYIQIAQEEGAKLLVGGDQPTHMKKGYYINPTVFIDVKPNMKIAQEEVFGPVVSIIPFSTEEQAISIANDVMYGLAAGVWTRDVARAHRMVKGLEAGSVWINTYWYMNWATPFGGYKESGLGKENGIDAINDFTQIKTVVIDIDN